jgi:rubrerythrin
MTRLDQEPRVHARTLKDVIGLAAAMEREAGARYARLAVEMKRRGDHGLAATFETMIEEERDHLAAIERWSIEATQAPPSEARFSWELPPEIARSWDEAMESATLTPYRALGIAVVNEERGFAFYSYIAAHAENASVRTAAEALAREELRHAALLRRERRRAWRRERQAQPAAELPSDSLERAHLMERQAAALHRAIAARLTTLGCAEDAAALAAAANEEGTAAAALDFAADNTPKKTLVRHLEEQDRAELLRAGLAEAERVYDAYADAVDHPGTEADLLAAQDGSARAVRHLGLITARLYAPGP